MIYPYMTRQVFSVLHNLPGTRVRPESEPTCSTAETTSKPEMTTDATEYKQMSSIICDGQGGPTVFSLSLTLSKNNMLSVQPAGFGRT